MSVAESPGACVVIARECPAAHSPTDTGGSPQSPSQRRRVPRACAEKAPPVVDPRSSPRCAPRGSPHLLLREAGPSSLETLLELPVHMQFIVLSLVQPDKHIP